MFLSDICIRRPVLATVISLILLIFGLFSFIQLAVREFPDVDPPVVNVATNYKGASAEVMESQVTRVIENSQRKVEAHNFDMRKQLLEYDDVANDQRKVIYEQRNDLMAAEDIGGTIIAIRADVVGAEVERFVPAGSLIEQWDLAGLQETLKRDFAFADDLQAWLAAEPDLQEDALRAEHAFDEALERARLLPSPESATALIAAGEALQAVRSQAREALQLCQEPRALHLGLCGSLNAIR